MSTRPANGTRRIVFLGFRELTVPYPGCGPRAAKLYFFGLDVVSKAVKNRWHEYPEPQKASMRGFMLSMLADCTQYRFAQEHAGREKFAAALVEIVKRDWPQQWPDFQGAALHVMERGPIEASVVCKVRAVAAAPLLTSA